MYSQIAIVGNRWLMFALPRSIADYETTLRDEFNILYAEGATRRRMMSMPLHDFVMGRPAYVPPRSGRSAVPSGELGRLPLPLGEGWGEGLRSIDGLATLPPPFTRLGEGAH
jgi:hypothetical protein